MVVSIEGGPINTEKVEITRYQIVEHKVSLQDSLVQLLTDPEEFTMVNLDRLSKLSLPFPPSPGSLREYWVDLSTEIKIEKRVVNSLLSLFGEVGGIN